MMKPIVFLLPFLFIFQLNLFAQNSPAKVISYNDLVHEVRAAFARGEERTADAVERERVQTYWEVGKLIDEHILLHKERAEYGSQVMKRLSQDLQISLTEIQYMVQFARAYPNSRTSGNLSWGHYETLLSINDSVERETLAVRTEKENLSLKELRGEVKKLKAKNPSNVNDDLVEEELLPIKGKLNTYRIVSTPPLPLAGEGRGEGKNLRIDIGFSNYLEIPEAYKSKFKEGDIIQAKNVSLQGGRKSDEAISVTKNATEADLYTYRARVLEVTDGDTIWLLVDLGFGISTKQQIRLRGIDCPEITTRDGQAAKAFVEAELKNIPEIIIATSKSDKYDRYLADIFYQKGKEEKYLNNELLKHGLAVAVRG